MLRILPLLLVSLIVAPPAYAVGVSGCGAVIAPGDHAELQADLACGTEGQYAIYLGKGAKLAMNGHRIIGANFEDGIGCNASCTVTGPGEIANFEYAVLTNGGTITVRDLDIHDCESGVTATRIVATNVSVHHCEESAFNAQQGMKGTGVTADDNGTHGFYGRKLVLIDSAMRRNGSHAVNAFQGFKGTNVVFEDNLGAGVVGGSIRGIGLTATGNQQGGVSAHPSLSLRDSTLVDNVGYDLASEHLPRLKDTVCGKSLRAPGPFGATWDVCTDD